MWLSVRVDDELHEVDQNERNFEMERRAKQAAIDEEEKTKEEEHRQQKHER